MVNDKEYCEYCGHGDLPHPQCEPTEQQLDIITEDEKEKLLEFSISGHYGVNETSDFSRAIENFNQCFETPKVFDIERVIENNYWWYIPITWIGCLGYIVMKDSDHIYCLGSGLLGMYSSQGYFGIWSALKAFQEGKIGVESLITN